MTNMKRLPTVTIAGMLSALFVLLFFGGIMYAAKEGVRKGDGWSVFITNSLETSFTFQWIFLGLMLFMGVSLTAAITYLLRQRR
jgi:hypothetical protein